MKTGMRFFAYLAKYFSERKMLYPMYSSYSFRDVNRKYFTSKFGIYIFNNQP
jgi:hypothetical protein